MESKSEYARSRRTTGTRANESASTSRVLVPAKGKRVRKWQNPRTHRICQGQNIVYTRNAPGNTKRERRKAETEPKTKGVEQRALIKSKTP